MKSLIEYINESNQVELVSDGNERGFEYVDLGLPSKTMWATCNVGADKPEDGGLLFQFGRVDGYRYRDKNSQFRTNDQNKQDTGNKFIPLTASGKAYKTNEILDLSDDAAHVNMSGKWRMPTSDELKELVDNTTHTVITVNGVKGMMFTSNINGQFMFIPFGGFWYDGKLGNSNKSYVFIRSSNVHDSDVNIAYLLFCGLSGNVDIYYGIRSYAFAVRGVFNN